MISQGMMVATTLAEVDFANRLSEPSITCLKIQVNLFMCKWAATATACGLFVFWFGMSA